MSRYTGPSWKQARRLGLSLTGTGKELARRNYVPGQHGPNNRSKLSEYGLQLAEKQKLRFTYGVGEKQFRNLFVQATKIKGGILGFNLSLIHICKCVKVGEAEKIGDTRNVDTINLSQDVVTVSLMLFY